MSLRRGVSPSPRVGERVGRSAIRVELRASGAAADAGEMIAAALVLLAAFPDGGLTPARPPAQAGPPPRPNVLLILCDDLGYGDLRCYGHPVIETPRIDALAAGGVRFTQFYATSPVCSPSRAGLMTGRSPDRAGIYDWIPDGWPVHLRVGETTLPAALAGAGYDTCQLGKWHLNGALAGSGTPGSGGQTQPGDFGVDHWFVTQNNAAPSHLNPTNFVRNGEPIGKLDGYSCNLVAAEAVRWLDGRPSPGAPFFANVWFHEPHLPIASPPDLVDRYRPGSRTENEAEYFANVANVDRAVGTLLDALEARGLTENTIVIFTSDNGPEDGRRYRAAAKANGSAGRLRGRKLWLYEGGVRVPGIVSWPGRIAPREEAVPTGAIDLLPTLCSLTGAAPPDRPLDGTDVSALWLDGTPPVRAVPLFWSYYRALGGPVAAIREGPFVLLGRRDAPGDGRGRNVNAAWQSVIRSARLGRFELYDLARDQLQYFDVAADRPEIAERMSAALTSLHAEVRDEAVPWDFPPASGE